MRAIIRMSLLFVLLYLALVQGKKTEESVKKEIYNLQEKMDRKCSSSEEEEKEDRSSLSCANMNMQLVELNLKLNDMTNNDEGLDEDENQTDDEEALIGMSDG